MLTTNVAVVVLAVSVTASAQTYAPAGGGRAQGVPNSLRVFVYARAK